MENGTRSERKEKDLLVEVYDEGGWCLSFMSRLYMYVVCFGLHQSLQNREKEKKNNMCASHSSKQIPKRQKKKKTKKGMTMRTDGWEEREDRGENVGRRKYFNIARIPSQKIEYSAAKQNGVERQDDDYLLSLYIFFCGVQ